MRSILGVSAFASMETLLTANSCMVCISNLFAV
jgi:hypothetical protein